MILAYVAGLSKGDGGSRDSALVVVNLTLRVSVGIGVEGFLSPRCLVLLER